MRSSALPDETPALRSPLHPGAPAGLPSRLDDAASGAAGFVEGRGAVPVDGAAAEVGGCHDLHGPRERGDAADRPEGSRTFPIDYDSLLDSHPRAYQGEINGKMLPLKNPGRAKAIVVRLVRDHAVEDESKCKTAVI
jgi:hypothetical protein